MKGKITIMVAALALSLAGCIGMSPPAGAAEAEIVLAQAIPTPPKRPVISLPIPTPAQEKEAARLGFEAPTLPAAPPAQVIQVTAPAIDPAVLAAAVAEAVKAAAPPPAPVKLGWGDWIVQALDTLEPLILMLGPVLLLPLLDKIPGPTGVLIRTFASRDRMQETLGRALAATKGAAAGKQLTVDVGNEVAATYLQIAADEWPRWLKRAAGGDEGIRKKVIGMLDLEPDATVS
jgi:hypothetical protein